MNKLDANSMVFLTQLIDLEYYQTPYDQSKGRKGAVLGKNCNYSIKNKQTKMLQIQFLNKIKTRLILKVGKCPFGGRTC